MKIDCDHAFITEYMNFLMSSVIFYFKNCLFRNRDSRIDIEVKQWHLIMLIRWRTGKSSYVRIQQL